MSSITLQHSTVNKTSAQIHEPMRDTSHSNSHSSPRQGTEFLNSTLAAQEIKPTIGKWVFMEFKSIYTADKNFNLIDLI